MIADIIKTAFREILYFFPQLDPIKFTCLIIACRDGGIGRHAGLRNQCPCGVKVRVLFPAL